MKGKVKSFSPQHGYGFIIGDLNEIFFFHANEWESHFKAKAGDHVEFEPVITDKGSRATKIRRVEQWQTK